MGKCGEMKLWKQTSVFTDTDSIKVCIIASNVIKIKGFKTSTVIFSPDRVLIVFTDDYRCTIVLTVVQFESSLLPSDEGKSLDGNKFLH